MSDVEEWRSIPSLPAYEASSLGRIRRVKPYLSTYVGRIRSAHLSRHGYLQVGLGTGSKKIRMCYVHRLVCEAFHGSPPSPHHVVAHRNGRRTDNAPDNLRWSTYAENESDKIAHGTYRYGEGHYTAKLTDLQVRLIRAKVAFGEPTTQVARLFRTSQANVWFIVHGRTRRSAGGFGIDEEV